MRLGPSHKFGQSHVVAPLLRFTPGGTEHAAAGAAPHGPPDVRVVPAWQSCTRHQPPWRTWQVHKKPRVGHQDAHGSCGRLRCRRGHTPHEMHLMSHMGCT